MDIRVSIYERVKSGGKWHERHVPMPKTIRSSKGGYVLHGKDDRQGAFLISWYERRKKKRQPVEGHYLSDAVKAARAKQYFLNSSRHGVQAQDPTTAPARPEVYDAVDFYLTAKGGCAKTLSAHTLALHEFRDFCARERIAYVDEITKAHVRRFYEELLEDDNCPFTAANKVLKVNSFYRAVMKLDAGHGIITKRDYKRELATSTTVETYTKAELDALFSHMDKDEHLLFSTIREAALRKKEAMYLEDTDLVMDELQPGIWKCELRIHSKPAWGWMTKTGQDRSIIISKPLMDRLQERKAQERPSTLLFPTANGKPNFHVLDALKSIAKRAGIDPATVRTHKLRATTATFWLRSKELGGMGRDIAVVRQQLGHTDYKSIEAYIAAVRNEELALREQADAIKAGAA